jgi:hypothetical protein
MEHQYVRDISRQAGQDPTIKVAPDSFNIILLISNVLWPMAGSLEIQN